MSKYYCKKCGELIKETDYLVEDYSLYEVMKKLRLCEKCLREAADNYYGGDKSE
jgi:hypothetical protein